MNEQVAVRSGHVDERLGVDHVRLNAKQIDVPATAYLGAEVARDSLHEIDVLWHAPERVREQACKVIRLGWSAIAAVRRFIDADNVSDAEVLTQRDKELSSGVRP